MISFLLITFYLVASGLVILLTFFAFRRLIFLFTLLRPQSPNHSLAQSSNPPILVLIPARNESASLPALFKNLDALDYPPDRLRIVLINDGSTDDTGQRMLEAARPRPHWQVHSLSQNVGKAQALNLALAAHDYGELIYILDADHHPAPDCLRLIAAAFADARVAGVSGQMRVANALTSPAAYYAAIESLVNQFITMRSKDILRLGPALLGSNNTYRRSALQAVNGFRAGAFLEDSDLTVMLHRAGYITRYLPQAISYHHAPITLVGYIRQHLRWGRGFNDVTRTHLGAVLTDARLPWPMRIELGMFSLGYLDRLALLGVIALLFFNWLFALTFHVLLFTGISLSLGLPLLHILAVLHYDRAPLAMWLRLPLVPLFFALDAAVAVYSALASILNRPRQWHPTERA